MVLRLFIPCVTKIAINERTDKAFQSNFVEMLTNNYCISTKVFIENKQSVFILQKFSA